MNKLPILEQYARTLNLTIEQMLDSCTYAIAQQINPVPHTIAELEPYAKNGVLVYASPECALHITLTAIDPDPAHNIPGVYAYRLDLPDGDSKSFGYEKWEHAAFMLPIRPELWKTIPVDVWEAITEYAMERRKDELKELQKAAAGLVVSGFLRVGYVPPKTGPLVDLAPDGRKVHD